MSYADELIDYTEEIHEACHPSESRTPEQRLAAAVLWRAYQDYTEPLSRLTSDLEAGRMTKGSANLRTHLQQVEEMRQGTRRWAFSDSRRELSFRWWAEFLGWGAGEIERYRAGFIESETTYEQRARTMCNLLGRQRTVQTALF